MKKRTGIRKQGTRNIKQAALPVLEPGKRIPDWEVKDSEGTMHRLWDYRQKSHLLLINEPDSDPQTRQRWLSAIEADRKQWDWLNVRVLVVAGPPQGLPPGAHAIDRYGLFINTFPSAHWQFDDLEREFLYYEARHC